MGVSLTIDVFVCTHNGGSPVMYSTGLQTNICDSPNNPPCGLAVGNFWVYTASDS